MEQIHKLAFVAPAEPRQISGVFVCLTEDHVDPHKIMNRVLENEPFEPTSIVPEIMPMEKLGFKPEKLLKIRKAIDKNGYWMEFR